MFPRFVPVALKTVRTRKLQSALSTLGIVIGVGAVMAAFAIIEGGKAEMVEKIRQLGANQLNVQNLDADEARIVSQRFNPSRGLTLADLGHIERELARYIDRIAPVMSDNAMLHYRTRQAEATVVGSSADLLSLHRLVLDNGRFLSLLDNRDHHRVCVLGAGISRRLFPFENPLGKAIRIGDDWFEVVGQLKSTDIRKVREIPAQYYFNEKVFIPYATAMLGRNSGSTVDRIDIAVNDRAGVREVAEGVDRILERLHHHVRDYKVTVPGELLRHEQESKRVFNLILFWSAALSLIVGGVGIMNVMLATVMERTMEVGLRRALGASRTQIIQQFLTETVLLTLTGGILGLLLGTGTALLVSSVLHWHAVVSMQAVLLGLVISIATGLLFGMYPAMRAAWMDPIRALRRE